MKKKVLTDRIMRFLKMVYLKLFRIHDTPQRIAVGLGLGVLLGVMPGTGPIAALFFAFIFRVNRASAFLGSVLTNTWLSIPTFLISVKIGSLIMGLDHYEVTKNWAFFIKNFRWKDLLTLSIRDIVAPILLGYLIVAFCIGILAYLITLVIVWQIHQRKAKENV